MPKVDLNEVVLYYSALSQSIYAGIPDKRAGKNKNYGVTLHKVDVTDSFWGCLIQRCEEGKDVVELRDENGELQFEVRVKDMRIKQKSRKKAVAPPSIDQAVDRRRPECIANWPDCEEGEYNPSCCRFPKSCSCTH